MGSKIGDKVQSADWKSEKHVPAITGPDSVKEGEWIKLNVRVGKEIAHPNTVEHHIRWIQVYYTPDDSKFTYDLGRTTFNSHGEGPIVTGSNADFHFTASASGTINAVSHCNIHGLWESSKKLSVS
ncbi:Neelaredoxin [Candidatus Bathyarchaeota archaeon]|jgi:superoxide reductase|nr:Neelaredoxin [Candidatus Bathyarchaeota archaeon]MBT4320746.1 Neelaredoxin [Candidatus Bathyarchaeota archaeon]MBT4424307.1 Neelaredoxin [Candidatus Bathyarchaeota archaeon]MBT5641551.1 Neelaredoxin [Candidatus Bathyarchaeota archaeon]MBT6604222.1 Neelaredoxin [Candidatus Bathyarchaeota archaeon]